MVYVDTNVIIDIIDDMSAKQAACLEKLEEALSQGQVFICDTVYAETSVGMSSREELDQVITSLGLSRRTASNDTLFRAGIAYRKYKQNTGPKNNVLPDFFIGAQAEVDTMPLITSDVKRMTGYFPNLVVINP